jgi:uncharacterized Zn finger protein
MSNSVAELLKNISLKNLALASNLIYGTAIYERGAVELIKISDHEIEAWAGGLSGAVKSGGGSRRHVWLWVKDDKLVSHCSGNPKNHDIFCKHCVAVSLKVLSI